MTAPVESIAGFGLVKFAEMTIRNDAAAVNFIDEPTAAATCAIYCWIIDGEIVRIGSSKQSLKKRIIGTGRWIETRLQGTARISDPGTKEKETDDAKRWALRLKDANAVAEVYGRSGTIVTTPLGEINVYLSEENWLLEQFKPPLNNSYFR